VLLGPNEHARAAETAAATRPCTCAAPARAALRS
jgi:hypothetical protein